MQETVVSMILSRFDQLDRSIAEDKRDSAESRRRVYEKLETQGKEIEIILSRLSSLEVLTSSMSPTINEYAEIKTHAVVAGRLGKFLLELGKIILAVAAAVVSTWYWAKDYFTAMVK